MSTPDSFLDFITSQTMKANNRVTWPPYPQYLEKVANEQKLEWGKGL